MLIVPFDLFPTSDDASLPFQQSPWPYILYREISILQGHYPVCWRMDVGGVEGGGKGENNS